MQVLSEEEFVQFYYLLMERPDIEEIFRVYADSATNRMTPERLARFFAEEQKMVLGAEECAAIIRNHEPTEDKSAFTQLGFVQFLMFSELQVWESTYIKAVLRNRTRNSLPYWNWNCNLFTDLSGSGSAIIYGSGTGIVIKWNHKSSHRHSIKLCI